MENDVKWGPWNAGAAICEYRMIEDTCRRFQDDNHCDSYNIETPTNLGSFVLFRLVFKSEFKNIDLDALENLFDLHKEGCQIMDFLVSKKPKYLVNPISNLETRTAAEMTVAIKPLPSNYGR